MMARDCGIRTEAAMVASGCPPAIGPYPAYRESGLVDWLGPVPEHWEVRRVKFLLRERHARSASGKEQLLRVSQYTGITKRRRKHTRAESLIGYRRVAQSDLVVNIMLAWNGSLGVSPFSGIVSPAYCVYRFRASTDPHYAHYLLRSPLYRTRIKTVSTGVVESRLRLYTDDLYRLEALLPPLPEQRAIARFLDHADRSIQRYIRSKERLIELLEEQKQAIIHQAVTGQIDVRTGQPYPAYKDSGVEWLGEVPEHWALSRVKGEFQCLNRNRVPLSSVERGKMTSRRYDYYGASGIIDKVDDYLFDDELLLIAEDGANLVMRNLPLAIIAKGRFWVNNHAHILKPRRGNIEFLAWMMEGLNYLPWISGAAQPKLTQDRLLGIAIAVPPRDEQDKVMALLKDETVQLTDAVTHAHQEIALVREYRTRLIADVVTGKLDVRDAAAALPDVDPIVEEPSVDELMEPDAELEPAAQAAAL